MVKQYFRLVFSFLFLCTLMACGESANEANTWSPARQPLYDFFNDVRAEIAKIEPAYQILEGFNEETLNFLETKETQQLYALSGMYFEKNLDRNKGALNYEDRFTDEGCIVHIIVYPPKHVDRYDAHVGIDRAKGKQVGKNYVYYQVFTAQPQSPDLENQLNEIIEAQLKKHAAGIGAVEIQ